MNNVLLIGNKSFTTSVIMQVRGLNALTVTVMTSATEAAEMMEGLAPDVVIVQAGHLIEGSVIKTFSSERHSTYFVVIEESVLYSPKDMAMLSPFVELHLEKTASAIESGADAYLWLPPSGAPSGAVDSSRQTQAVLEIADKRPALSQKDCQAEENGSFSGSLPQVMAAGDTRNLRSVEQPKQPLISTISFRRSQCRLIQAHIQIGLNRAQRYRDLSRINDWLSAVALVDALTQLSNRRAFDLELPRQIKVARAQGKALSIMVLDIDFFKSVNDRYGHLVGDDVLKMLAKRLLTNMRFYDTPFRYGGEEFVVTLNNTDLQEGMVIAQRLRQSIAQYPFELTNMPDDDGKLALTVSIGLAELQPEDDDQGRNFLHRADQCLLKAKASGRNRVVNTL